MTRPVDDPAGFHGAYLPRSREMLDALVAGEHARAREALAGYLDDARAAVAAAVAR